MEKNVKIGILLDMYGKLLTEKQKCLLEDYYNNDLSLSEIAENEGITRQAVRDNLKKGENNILEYEEKLEFMKRNSLKEKKINSIISKIEKIEKNELLDKKTKSEIQKIKKEINSLI